MTEEQPPHTEQPERTCWICHEFGMCLTEQDCWPQPKPKEPEQGVLL